MTKNEIIKKRFGKRFCEERKNISSKKRKAHISRKEMSDVLKISPKTIQSWEMGRTVPEDLSLIKKIHDKYSIDMVNILHEAIFPKSETKTTIKM